MVERIFDPDTAAEEIAALCAEKGIRYLVYSPAFPGSESRFAGFEKVYGQRPDADLPGRLNEIC